MDVIPHEFEPEVGQPTPRVIRRRAGTGVLFGWRGNLLLFAHFCFVMVIWACLQILAIIWLGHPTSGIVTRHSSAHDKGTQFYLQYVVDAGGRRLPGWIQVDEDVYGGLSDGEPIPVRVVQLGPLLLHGAPQLDRGTGILWITPLMGVLMAYVARESHIKRLLYRWLVARGEPVHGRVLEKRVVERKGTSRFLRYEYAPAGGGTLRQWMRVHKADWEALQVGDPVTVLCHPTRARWSVIYRCADYEALPTELTVVAG